MLYDATMWIPVLRQFVLGFTGAMIGVGLSRGAWGWWTTAALFAAVAVIVLGEVNRRAVNRRWDELWVGWENDPASRMDSPT